MQIHMYGSGLLNPILNCVTDFLVCLDAFYFFNTFQIYCIIVHGKTI